MKEYIDREAILSYPLRADRCDREHANEHFIFGIESVMEFVETLPADDVVPVRHGRWVRDEWPSGTHKLICSECGEWSGKQSKYCPNCGALMDGERKGEDAHEETSENL